MKQLVAVALAGCGFSPAAVVAHGDARGSADATKPEVIDASVGCTTHAVPPSVNVDAMQWHAEFLAAPAWNCTAAGTTTIDSKLGTISSTSCTLGGYGVSNGVTQLAGGPTVMVVRLGGLTIAAGHTLRLVGDKPIIVLVAGDVTVDTGGMIDASAAADIAGPGAIDCADHAGGLGGVGTSPNWGGGGGGYGTAGGQGCYQVTNGGLANGTAGLTPLRGGCNGGIGNSTMASGQVAGAGGGAIEISATGTISIGATSAANIVASGGGAPANDGGGNGGGAGGGIVLVAPALATFGAAGAARANGGAGSEGCSSSCSGPASGTDGHKTDSTGALDTSGTPGGGNNQDHGRRGGTMNLVGAAVTSTPGDMITAQNGGRGGGGGGGGRIVVTAAAATMSCD